MMNLVLHLSSLVTLLIVLHSANASLDPTLEIEQGKLLGKALKSRDGRDYLAFRNVPYGSAERFQNPTPAGKWDGVYNATEHGEICAQVIWASWEKFGVEDCLKLNVYTPATTGKKNVLVYFHGGGFTLGNANYYHADYFMDEDVVLVIVNYRVGPLGFLSTQDDVITGNFGLKDQNLALKWVQKNIEKFGGDPKSVTIFGSSAGGASVHYQILSPRSAGLFHAAISQSGSALCQWAFSTKPKEMAVKFSKHLNCPTENSQELSECLKGLPVSDILDGMEHLAEWSYDPFTPFGPTIEHGTSDNPEDYFLTEHPEDLLKSGKFNQVPWMTSLDKDEGILMHSAYYLNDKKLTEDLRTDWKRIFSIPLHYNEVYTNLSKEEQEAISEKIYNYYFGGKEIGEETREELTQVFSDRIFNTCVRDATLLASKHVPVYPAIYSYRRPDWNVLQFFGMTGDYGVPHADELSVLFSKCFDMDSDIPKGSKTETISRNMIKLWTSMAQNKKPSVQWTRSKSYTDDWRPISAEEANGSKPLQYYDLNTETSITQEPFTERLEFWSGLVKEIYSPSSSPSKDEL